MGDPLLERRVGHVEVARVAQLLEHLEKKFVTSKQRLDRLSDSAGATSSQGRASGSSLAMD